MSERLNIPDRELLAALGTMLATWDDATAKMVAFMQNQNPETAKAYSECMPRMFDAACLAREVHSRFRGRAIEHHSRAQDIATIRETLVYHVEECSLGLCLSALDRVEAETQSEVKA